MTIKDIIANRRNTYNNNTHEIDYKVTNTKDLSHIDTFLKVISNNNRLNITYSNSARVGFYTPALNSVTLPYYITKDRDLYLLMGSHEISHVLHTPKEFLDNHDGSNSNATPTVRGVKFSKVLMNCINIVEDIRIERLIRNKFPGFVAVYERGYSKFLDGMFHIDDEKWSDMNIGDRINSKAKLGKLLTYELTTYEEGIFRYVKDTKDFNDVLIKSLYLYNIMLEDEKHNDKEQDKLAEDECEAEGDNANIDPDKEDNNPKDSKDSDEDSENDNSDGDSTDGSDKEDERNSDESDGDSGGSKDSIDDIISKLQDQFNIPSDDFSEELLQQIADVIEELGELDADTADKLSSNTLEDAKDEYINDNISDKHHNFNPASIKKYTDIVKNPSSIMNKIF